MSGSLKQEARRTVIGMALQASEGREDLANELLTDYINEATERGYSACQGLVLFAQVSVGVVIGTEVGTDWMRGVAEGLAVRSS